MPIPTPHTEPEPDRPAVIDAGRTPSPRRRTARPPSVVAAVALGGALGSLARAGIGVAWSTDPGHLPYATLLINVSGSFALGIFLVALLDRGGPGRLLRPFVATGFLGGYTTFSTFMVETVDLGRTGHLIVSASYLVTSLVLGLGAAWIGVRTGRRCFTRLPGKGVPA